MEQQHHRKDVVVNHVVYSDLFTKKIEKWNKIVRDGGFDFIVLDFDKTMTTSESATPWCLFDRSDFASEKTKETMSRLYEKHCPIETSHSSTIEEKIKNAEEWYEGTLGTLSLEINDTHRLQEALSCVHPYGGVASLPEARKNCDTTVFLKEKVVPFLKVAKESNVPCVIFSAGLGDMIDHILRQYDDELFGVHIVSNFLTFDFKESGVSTYASHMFEDRKRIVHVFENYKTVGWTSPVVHCANKNVNTLYQWLEINAKKNVEYVKLTSKLNDAKHVLLAGDMLSDAHMSDGLNEPVDIVKVCFHEKKFNQHKETVKNLDQFYDHEKLEHATTIFAKQRKPLEPEKNVTRPLFKTVKSPKTESKDETLILGDHDYTFLEDFEKKKEAFDVVVHNCKGASFDVVYALLCESLCGTNVDSDFFKTESNDTIAVSGFARNGKSTFGERVVKAYPPKVAACFAFADKLRWVASIVDPAIPVTQSERESLFESINAKDENQDIQNYNALVGMFGYETSKSLVKSFRKSLIALGEGFRNYLKPSVWIDWLFDDDLKIESTNGRRLDNDDAHHRSENFAMTKDFLDAFFTIIGYDKEIRRTFKETGTLKHAAKDDFFSLNMNRKNLERCFSNFLTIWESLVENFEIHSDIMFREFALALDAEYQEKGALRDVLEIVFAMEYEKEDIVSSKSLQKDLMNALLSTMLTNAYERNNNLLKTERATVVDAERDESYARGATTNENKNDKSIKKIITDARYHNEREYAFDHGAMLVYVFNPNLEQEPPVTELASYEGGYYHVNLRNDGGMKSYEKMIDETLRLQLVCKKHLGSRIVIDLRGSDFDR